MTVKRRGFTAFEVLLASTILALVSISVSAALTAGRQESRAAQNGIYASLLARALMDEILRYAPSNTSMAPGSTETKRRRNDNYAMAAVSDYDTYTDGVGTSITSINDVSGNAYPAEYQVFTRTVSVTTTSLQPTGWSNAVPGVLVTITVSRGGQTVATLQRYISPS